jgi:hypothetical protein
MTSFLGGDDQTMKIVRTKNIQNVLHRMITDRLNLVNDVNPVTIIRSTSIANDK